MPYNHILIMQLKSFFYVIWFVRDLEARNCSDVFPTRFLRQLGLRDGFQVLSAEFNNIILKNKHIVILPIPKDH